MSSRKLRSREVISVSSTTPLNQSNIKLKQTKIVDWLGSPSNGDSQKNLAESDNSQSCSSSSSPDSLTEVTSTSPRTGSDRLKKPSNSSGRNGEDSPKIVLQLDGIQTCNVSNCNYKTSIKVNLERHKKIKHELKRLKCPNRDYVTHSNDALNRRTFHSYVTFNCKLCSWTTPIRLHLTQHMKQTHGRAKLRRESEFGKAVKCSISGFGAVKKQETHLHNNSHETEKMYKCSSPGCDYRTKTAYTLREHEIRHDVESKKEFRCPLCSKLFWTILRLHKHIPFHTKEKNFSCSQCNFATSYAGNLVAHKRKHAKKSSKTADKLNAKGSLGVSNNEQSLLTSYTGNSRSDSSLNGCGNILRNEATATKLEPDEHDKPKVIKKQLKNPTKVLEKKHKCDHCDFTAVYKCKIIRHAVVHRHPDDKIHSCSFAGCDFKTNWDEYLKKHYRVMHKSLPDLICPTEGCDFQTKWKECLAQHQKKKHERRKRNYQCLMCLKAFYDSRGLQRHINIHTEENKYKCSLCDYVSGERSNFYAHRRKYHAGQECELMKFM